MKYMPIEKINEYIPDGVVGADIKIPFLKRFKLLFYAGVSVAFISPKAAKIKTQ